MEKPGWKTTEFYVAVAAQLAGLGILFGWVTPEQLDTIKSATAQIAGGIIMAIAGIGYAISRGIAKFKKG